MRLTRLCLEHPVAVTIFYIAVAVIGIVSFLLLGRSVLPNVAFPTISVVATYPGAGPDELERLAIEPLEDALANVGGIERLNGYAQNGTAQLVAEFHFGTPLERAQNDVQQAVDAARVNLPADMLPPVVSRDDPSTRPVIELAVTSAALSMRSISVLLDGRVLPALRATPGVGSVRSGGEPQRILLVEPRAAAMTAAGATGLDVLRAMQGAATLYPGGTSVAGGEARMAGVRADADSPETLLQRIVTLPATSLPAYEIANARDAFADPITLSSFDGDPAMLLAIAPVQGGDANATIAAVRRTVARLRDAVPLLRIDEYHSDRPFTEAALSGVQQTLLEGIALTVLTMLLFLHSWRSAAIAALAIPSSLLATFSAMRLLGFSIDVLSLMGLSMTVGILVDDSIVIIEAIARAVERGLRGDDAALAGRGELGGAAFAITLVDVAVFLPMALMEGIVGEFMREFAAVIVVATVFSLLVSFTLTPLLCARWSTIERRARMLPWTLRRGPLHWIVTAVAGGVRTFSRFEGALAQRLASEGFPFAWRYRYAVLAIAAFSFAASFVPLGAGAIPMEFSPPAGRGEVLLDLQYPAGTPLRETDAGVRALAGSLLDDDRVADVVTTAGRASNGTTDVIAPNVARIGVELRDQSSDGQAVASEAKARAPAGSVVLESGRGMGGMAPIAFELGGDPRALSKAAGNIAGLLRNDPYATDVRRSDVGVADHLEYRVDDARANLLGVSSDDAALAARIVTGGALATRVRTDEGLTDVIVRSAGGAYVRARDGTLVPAGDVLSVTESKEPVSIDRENRARVVSVTANAAEEASIGDALRAIAGALSRALPPGTFVLPRGDIEQFLETLSAMLRALGLSVLLCYGVLAVLYRSYRLPLIVMTSVPLASIGAFGALALTHRPLNLYSMLGIVLLVGLVAKNGILLVEFAERRVRDGIPAMAAMQYALQRRFRPIVMTTVAMIGGMLPLALGRSAGEEYRSALGTVVIGGLASSLLLTFFVVPVVFTLWARASSPAVTQHGEMGCKAAIGQALPRGL